MREPHIIYGYRCKVGKRAGQWKIGCTLQRQEKNRHDRHREGNSECPLFDRYLKAREREGYSFDEVFNCFNFRLFSCERREAERWESIYTEWYNAIEPHGFCINSGNYNGSSSDTHRKRLSDAHKGIKHTEEARKKISAALIGKKRKPVSEVTRRKISQANRGRKMSEETRQKLRDANLGRKMSEENKRKIAAAKVGKKMPEFSALHRARLRAAHTGEEVTPELIAQVVKKTKSVVQMSFNKWTRRWSRQPERCLSNFELAGARDICFWWPTSS